MKKSIIIELLDWELERAIKSYLRTHPNTLRYIDDLELVQFTIARNSSSNTTLISWYTDEPKEIRGRRGDGKAQSEDTAAQEEEG